jgi:hypothetical protein
MRKTLSGLAVAAAVGCCQGCGATAANLSAPDVNSRAAVLAEFRQRIDAYMELREDIVDEVGEAQSTRDPADIRGREEALAKRILARRAAAKHGDILTPQIRAEFRGLLRPELKGEQGEDIRAKLNDDAPAPGAVPIEVNARYPAGVPFATTPYPVLLALPTLPPGLEFRFVGKDLILLDQPADVILDYMRNAIS